MSARDPEPQRGDEHELFRRFEQTLRNRTGRAVRTTPENIDDACAYAWMQFVIHQPERDTALAWLTVVARRRAMTLRARDNRHIALAHPDGKVYATIDPQDLIAAREAVLAARDELAPLPERTRMAVVMRGMGYSHAEIANELEVKTTRAHQLVQRGQTTMRNTRRAEADASESAPNRLKVLDHFRREPPLWLRDAIGRCPTSSDKAGREALRMRWCALAMRMLDYRVDHGISDPLKALGTDREPDAERTAITVALDDFVQDRRGRRDRGLAR